MCLSGIQVHQQWHIWSCDNNENEASTLVSNENEASTLVSTYVLFYEVDDKNECGLHIVSST